MMMNNNNEMMNDIESQSQVSAASINASSISRVIRLAGRFDPGLALAAYGDPVD